MLRAKDPVLPILYVLGSCAIILDTLEVQTRLQRESPGYILSLSNLYVEPGWLEVSCGYPVVEQEVYEPEEAIPGPPFSVTAQPYGPTGVLDQEERRHVSEQGTMTDDLESGHQRRYANAAEGEQWTLRSWFINRVKELLGDRSFNIGIDEVNLCHLAMAAIGVYSSLKYGEAEGYRLAFPAATPVNDFALCQQIGQARFQRLTLRLKIAQKPCVIWFWGPKALKY